MAEYLRVDCVDLLGEITNCEIEVHEESAGVFIPVNRTAEIVTSILTISHRDRIKKEYFTPQDLWCLWCCGYEIKYTDILL